MLSQFALSQKKGRYSWSRLGDLFEANKLNIFKDTRDLSNDIVQGELGDCYFLSVLAAFAEDSNIIADLIDPKGKVNDGSFITYIFRFIINFFIKFTIGYFILLLFGIFLFLLKQ